MATRILRFGLVLVLSSWASAAYAQYKVDTREVITLSKEEKAWLMNEMRGHFAAIQCILSAIAQGNAEAAKQSATDRGVRHLSDPTRMKFPQKTTDTWKAFAASMHKGFDGVADLMARGAAKEETVAGVAALMQNCIGCHATYHIVEE